MGLRRTARECALKLLYQKEMTALPDNYIIKEFWEIEKDEGETKTFAEELFFGVRQNIVEIDEKIKKCVLNWDKERITPIDLSVLRIAIYEMMFLKEIPNAVSINEAIDIAKKYSTIESGKFVNGILDKAKSVIILNSEVERENRDRRDWCRET